MKILLTGGNGFIGRNIIEKLGDRYEILAPSSFELNLLDDSAVTGYIEKYQPEVIIHAASTGLNLGQDGEQSILDKNLRMFFNLLHNKKYFKKMIVLGSGAEYDKSRDISMVREEDFDSSVPVEQYAFSKYVMSKIAESEKQIIHLRLFGIFGPYENYLRRFISNVICLALLDLPITIKQNAFLDYLYVNDFITILESFLKSNNFQHRIYNVGRGERIDLLTIANLIMKVVDKKLPIRVLNDNLNKEYTCDISRLKNELRDIEFTNLEMAITELVNHYTNILPTLNKKLFIS